MHGTCLSYDLPSDLSRRESADRVVLHTGKYEELIVCSHEIAASTAQLVAASKVGTRQIVCVRLVPVSIFGSPQCRPTDAFRGDACLSCPPARSSEEGKLFLFSSQSGILIRVSPPALIVPHLEGLVLEMKTCKNSRLPPVELIM